MSRPQKSESEEEFASAPEDNDDGDSNVPGEKSRQDKSKKPVDVNNDEMTTKGKGKEVSTGNEVAESEPAATVREINEILNEMSADSENLLQEKTEDEQTDRTRNIDKQGDRNEEKSRETVDNEEVVAVESTYGQETEAVTAGNIRDALISSTGDIRESGEPQSSAHFTGDIKDALRAVTDKKASKPASSGWGWGGWLSSTASALGQGLQSAIHTVEETLGIPEPEEIAKHTQNDDTAEEGKKEIVDSEPQKSKTGTTETVKTTDVEEESSSTFSMWSGMSALSSVIASKSSELVSGGIDALEAIGRKTMDVISDGDPGLRQKRAAIQELTSGPAVVLSKLLRDAKQQAEENQNSNAETGIHFSTLFDEYQGFVHLEALELLSTECSSKLQSAQVAIEDDEVMKQLQDIKEAFQLKNDDEEEDVKDQTVEITSFLLLQFEKLKIQYKAQKLEKVEEHIVTELASWKQQEGEQQTAQAIFESGMRGLAQLTASSIEVFRKVSELILLHMTDSSTELPTAIERSQTLNEMAVTITKGVSCVSAQFADSLNLCRPAAEEEGNLHDDVKSLITSLYLEASNCTTYIQDAFQLLQPVLQLTYLSSH